MPLKVAREELSKFSSAYFKIFNKFAIPVTLILKAKSISPEKRVWLLIGKIFFVYCSLFIAIKSCYFYFKITLNI
jgi:hypothetical protein